MSLRPSLVRDQTEWPNTTGNRHAAPFQLSYLRRLLTAPQAHNLLGQSLQLLLIQNLVVHHSNQQLFDRSSAETVDDLSHRSNGHVLRRRQAAVDVGAALYPVVEITLLFEP